MSTFSRTREHPALGRPNGTRDASGPEGQNGTRDAPLADSLRPRGPVRFEVSEHEENGTTILQPEGEVDVITAPKLAAQLDAILRGQSGDVVVDLSQTEFLDSAGLHVLLNAQRRLTRRSRRLRVICAPGPVRHVIELARLVETLNVTDPE